MRPIDFNIVAQVVSLDDVLRILGWRAEYQTGPERRGSCPIHPSGHAVSRSFAVKGNMWYCHVCKKGGNQIDLYQLVSGKPVLEAAVEMCKKQGVPIPYLPRRPRKPRPPRTGKRNP
jgi:DNA primase